MEAKIDNYRVWVKGSQGQALKKDLEKVLKEAGFTLLNLMEHHFDPIGYTALWLLAESHCALHTFPEEDKTYIELSSCNRQMYIDFMERFSKAFIILD